MNRNQVFIGPKGMLGTRPDAAIMALTNIGVSWPINAKVPAWTEDVALVLDYMTYLELKAALVDRLCAEVANLPVLIERAAHQSILTGNQGH